MAIVRNADVKGETSWAQLWANDFWGQPIASGDSHKSYRPLCVLSFRLNYWAHGLAPAGYHVVNVAAHALASALIVALGRQLQLPPGAAVLGGLVFAVHPIHTEAVAGVVGRADVLCTVGFLISVLLYLRAIDASSGGCARRCAAFVGALACAAAATLCKELGFTTLPVLIALDLFASAEAAPRASRAQLMWVALRVALVAAFAAAMLALRVRTHGGHSLRQWTELENSAVLAERWEERVMSVAYLHARYAAALVWPADLCYDWGFDAIPVIASLLDARNALTVLAYGATAASIGAAAAAPRGPMHGPMLRCMLCALLPFAPMSNILFPVGTMLGERLLYLPSVGVCLAAGIVLSQITGLKRVVGVVGDSDGAASASSASESRAARGSSERSARARQRRGVSVICALLAFAAARTVRRNADWRDELALFEAGFVTAPNSVKVRNNLAQVLLKDGTEHSAARAVELLAGALARYPAYPAAELNLGLAHRVLGEYVAAEAHFAASARLNPGDCRAALYLGQSRVDLDGVPGAVPPRQRVAHLARARDDLARATRLGCDVPLPAFLVANLDAAEGRVAEAVVGYRRALALNAQSGLDPSDVIDAGNARNMLGLILQQSGRSEEAVLEFAAGLAQFPAHFALLVNGGAAENALGHADVAMGLYKRALAVDPLSFALLNNIAWLAETAGDLVEARAYYEKALALAPTHAQVRGNLERVLRRQKEAGGGG
jgi:tetratricopeptide (TPR) repeat protein